MGRIDWRCRQVRRNDSTSSCNRVSCVRARWSNDTVRQRVDSGRIRIDCPDSNLSIVAKEAKRKDPRLPNDCYMTQQCFIQQQSKSQLEAVRDCHTCLNAK